LTKGDKGSRTRLWKIEAKAEKTAELTIYGPIASEVWWGDEVTPKEFKKELDALGDGIDTLNIYINSPGGEIFAGNAICNMLERHSAKKITFADGLAASMGSVLFLIGDERHVYQNSMIMIHNGKGGLFGDAEQFRAFADKLDKVNDTFINMYESKTTIERAKIMAMMKAETWMNCSEAMENGFATHLDEGIKMVASIDGDFLVCGDLRVDTKNFTNFEDTKLLIPAYREAPPEPVTDKILTEQNQKFQRIRLKLTGGN
jgi:ATP-dependent Clp protease protease subunit